MISMGIELCFCLKYRQMKEQPCARGCCPGWDDEVQHLFPYRKQQKLEQVYGTASHALDWMS